MNRADIYAAIDTERERQDSLHGPRSIASPDVSDLFRLAVTTCDWTAEARDILAKLDGFDR